jgi:hypothetical protein
MKRIICAIAMLALSANLPGLKQPNKARPKETSRRRPGSNSTLRRAASCDRYRDTWAHSRSGRAASALCDSTITEDKNGNVASELRRPLRHLLFKAQSRQSSGGVKFPDGSLQTSAASGTVTHDSTLAGTGTVSSPLGLAVPLIFSGSVSNGIGVITVSNVAPGSPALFGHRRQQQPCSRRWPGTA